MLLLPLAWGAASLADDNEGPGKNASAGSKAKAGEVIQVERPAVSSAGAGSKLVATIRKQEPVPQQISLISGHSIVVDLTEAVTRCQIVDPEIAAVAVLSPRQILVTSKKDGSTQLLIWDANEGHVAIGIMVRLDLEALDAAITEVAPKSNIQVRSLNERLLLTGTVSDVDTAERIEEVARAWLGEQKKDDKTTKIVNHINVAGVNQVLLRCTVAEVSKAAIRKLGVNGWLAGDNVRDMFVINQLDGINPSNIGLEPNSNLIQPKIAAGAVTESGAFGTNLQATPAIPLLAPPQGPEFSLAFPRIQMQLFFRALRENRLLKVLAEPNLIALSGQQAKFLAGGEFPVPVPQGLGTTSIEWKQFGVLLQFTPTVIGKQMIRLAVRPEVSERDTTTQVVLQGGTTVPGIKSRTAETLVELPSGSTIAIAGLLSDQIQAAARKVPALGDVPILGALFSSVEYQKNMTELVILVTPELVAPMNPDQVGPVPGQYMTEPSDYELFGLGLLEGKPAAETPDDDAALETNVETKYRKFPSKPEQMSLHGPWGPAGEAEAVQ